MSSELLTLAWEKGTISAWWGLSSHAKQEAPPSPNCVKAQRKTPLPLEKECWWRGQDVPGAAASIGGQIPLCKGLGTQLSSTQFFLSDSALFW